MDEDTLNLIERYRQGDESAAAEIYRRYVERLTSLAQRRLSAKAGRRLDAEDIVQSAFRTFFGHAQHGEFRFDDNKDLWHLLAVITLNKLRRKIERMRAAKRGYDVEQSQRVDDTGGYVAEAVSRDAAPDEAAMLDDELLQLQAGMDDIQRRILDLRLQGFQIEEIAVEVSRSERTVRRVLDKVKAHLEERLLSCTAS